MLKRSIALALFISVAGSALAATPITDPSLINDTDVVQWNAYDPDFTTGATGYFPFTGNGAYVESVNNFSGVGDGGLLEVRTEGASWTGVMNPGDGVLFFHNEYATTGSVLHISFDVAVSGWAMQVQSNSFGDYSVYWGMWDGAYGFGGNPVGFGATTGVNDGGQAGTNGWIGGVSGSADIKDIYIQVIMSDATETFGSGFGPLHVGTPVPEPATMAILGAGLLPFLRRRNKKA